ncbi:MAG: FIST C-terminal domain-containing protein, partial [Giesbergeria sp.]
DPQEAVRRIRSTLAGLTNANAAGAAGRTGHFGTDTRVRHILGLDGARQGVALADTVVPGMQLAFCQRNAGAARADLVRICTEIREELAPEETEPSSAQTQRAHPVHGTAPALAPGHQRGVAGAIYVSCSGRGGPHFGAPGAELQIVRHALGDVPLVGFFAAGEIARNQLYGYTGVLTVFCTTPE